MDTIFGINPGILDISLRCIYTDMSNINHIKVQNCKEMIKFSSIEIYVSDEIVNNIKQNINSEFLPEDNKFMAEIEKFFVYRKNKVILKINFLNFGNMFIFNGIMKKNSINNNFKISWLGIEKSLSKARSIQDS